MNRRAAIKSIGIVSGGLISLPAWIVSCGVKDTDKHHTSFSADEQLLLAQVTDTIIPAGNSVGALAMGVDKFIQVLVDDCYEKEDQLKFKKNLEDLNHKSHLENDMSFGECSQDEREKLLLEFAESQDKAEQEFYQLIKSEVIRGFTTSQQVMTEYLDYQVAPGHYYGSVKIHA